MISAGMTTGSDKNMNITSVIRNVLMSLIHSLNSTMRSTFQKLCFFIPAPYAIPRGAVKGVNVKTRL
jgi:hypothetical protein